MSQLLSALKTGQSKLWVLLIGVNRYHDRRFPSLQYSEADCQGLAEALTEATRAFPNPSIDIHHDSALLMPTLASVRANLQEIVEHAKAQDTVLIYFCGQSTLEIRFQQPILCLADTEWGRLHQTGLSMMSLLGMLSGCAAKQQLLWLNVNQGNGIEMTEESEGSIIDDPAWQLIEILQQHVSQHPGFQAFLSCDRAQRSWNFPELGHSVFTHFLIQGLQGKAANAQGAIDFEHLAKYVQVQMQQYLEKTNQQLSWLHQQDQKGSANPVKPFIQTPRRLGKSIEPVILGMKPIDPLDLISKSASVISQPETIGIPTFQPSETIPQSAKIETLETIPSLIEKAAPIEQPEPIQKVEPPVVQDAIAVEEIPTPAPIQEKIPTPEPEEPLIEELPLVQASFSELPEISATETVIDPTPVQNEPLELEPVNEPIVQSTQIPANPVEPPVQLPVITSKQEIERPSARVEQPPRVRSQPRIKPPQRSQPKPDHLKRYTQKIQQATRSGAQQLSSTIQTGVHQLATTTIALKGSAQQLAMTGGTLCRKHSAQLSQAALASLHGVSATLHQLGHSARQAGGSIRQITQAGQTLYRERNTQLRQSTSATAATLNQSARRLAQSATEQSSKPQTRTLVAIALGGCGVAALGWTGFNLYQQRTAQIRDLQTLISTSQTQLTNQSPDALITALKASRKFQAVDRPWNFLPEDMKTQISATLQQAIVQTSGQFSATLEDKFNNIALNSDQKTFAVTTQDRTIQLWQREDNQLQRLNTIFKGHQGTIAQIRFSPDGKFLASASEDKTVKIWDVEKGILVRTLTGHTGAVTALEFRSDGGVLATGSADQTIRLWSVANGNLLDTLKDNTAIVNVIRFSPDGRILATGSADNVIRVWYPDSNKPILLGRHDSSTQRGITDLAFSADGKTIASTSGEPDIKLWSVSDAKSEQAASARATLKGHAASVTSLSFSPTGKLLASGSQDKTIKLWNLQNNAAITTLSGHRDAVTALRFESDGKTLLSGSDRNGLIQWSLNLPTLIQEGCDLIQGNATVNPLESDELCQP